MKRTQPYMKSQRQLMAAKHRTAKNLEHGWLTGLNNRRRFDEYASTEWRRAVREQVPLGLLLVDIDQFKHYNDANGHLAGDELLRRIGESIRTCCGRPGDLPARYGGDESPSCCPEYRPRVWIASANGCARRYGSQDRARRRHCRSVRDLERGGCRYRPDRGRRGGRFDRHRRQNMYEAKAKGRNKFIFHE